ncbi:MAG TPA: Mur ligase domain-containing protein, partial [Streptosporangiaceae bacterium]
MRPLTGLAALLGLRQPDSDSSFIHHELRGVSGITHDSNAVRPGDLYAALPGSRHHGASFCAQAAEAGAV